MHFTSPDHVTSTCIDGHKFQGSNDGAMGREARSRSGCAKSPRYRAVVKSRAFPQRPRRVDFTPRRWVKIRGRTTRRGGNQLAESNVVGHLLWQVRRRGPGLLSATRTQYIYICIHNYIVVAPRDRRPIVALTSQLFR